MCTDVEVHRARITGRVRGIPGWHEVGWHHVDRVRSQYPPLTASHITVGGINPFDENLRYVLDQVNVQT
ncbi:hypothetical protein ACFP2T_12625 [Plantactinospora solaniradicis]|uniref:Uncharacterized protein n=1 Tax=Plantactinospora solaniradicis TaxID=1723736 RepID=A0ABW1K5I7_9ACTN